MDDNTPTKLTKLDVARRQIDAAIHLYFHDVDQVSVYSLAAASKDILKDVATSKGLSTGLDRMMEYVKPEYHKYFIDFMNKPRNFFKHAKDDPDDVLTFYPQSPDMLLFICCVVFGETTGQPSLAMEAFFTWFVVHNPELIGGEGDFKDMLREMSKKVGAIKKKLFYERTMEDKPNLEILKNISTMK